MLKTLLTALALMAASITHAAAQQDVGKVDSIQGTATARGASGEARTLKAESPVLMNDHIVTGPGSRISIRFVDGTTVGEGENAELVINQYVFDPANKDANAAHFKLLKGIFRFVTDQITKLHPEGFEVEANYGTIGIRGCEIGFQAGAEGDEVYVIGLAGKEAVFIQLAKGQGPRNSESYTLIKETGIAVALSRAGLRQRRFDPAELQDLIDRTSPLRGIPAETGGHAGSGGGAAGEEHHAKASSHGGGGSQEFGGWSAYHGSAYDGGHGPNDLTGTVGDNGAGANSANTANSAVANVPPAPGGGGTGSGNGGQTGAGGSGGGAAATQGSGPSGGTSGGNQGGGSGGTPAANSGPNIQTTFGPRTQEDGASGADWSWGIWSRQITSVYPDGSRITKKNYHVSTAGNYLTSDQVQAIAAGSMPYALHGRGSLGAVVTYKDQAEMLSGTLNLDVYIGNGVSPTWSGIVSAGNGSESLRFDASGPIGSDGSLNAQQIHNYLLNAYGFSLGIPPGDPGSMVHGNLVGSGSGSHPISGGVLGFHVDHPNAPTVQGAGGVDLN